MGRVVTTSSVCTELLLRHFGKVITPVEDITKFISQS